NRAAVGGGIYSQGKLTVKNSTISLNTAMRNTNNPSLDLYGGGIYGDGTSNTTLVKTTVTDNLAAFRGGGIHTDGKLTVKKSLVQNNIALNAHGYYSYGGGIHNTGKVTIADSTIQYNSALTYGGGITNFGSLTVKNSTLSTNSAFYGGGLSNGYETANLVNSTLVYNVGYGDAAAVYNDDNGTVQLFNVTVALNNNYNSVGYSGGLYRVTGTIRLRNSIVALNAPH